MESRGTRVSVVRLASKKDLSVCRKKIHKDKNQRQMYQNMSDSSCKNQRDLELGWRGFVVGEWIEFDGHLDVGDERQEGISQEDSLLFGLYLPFYSASPTIVQANSGSQGSLEKDGFLSAVFQN